MPLYEYQCDACGRRFEKIRKFSDPPIEVCPTCGGHVQKLVSSPAFQFKGSGWYVTDYSRKDKGGSDSEKGNASGAATAPATASGDKGSASAPDSGGSASSGDSKPAAAPAKDAPASTTKS